MDTEDNTAGQPVPPPVPRERRRVRISANPGSPWREPKFFMGEVFGQQYRLPFLDLGSGTKEHILLSATILFAKKGYQAVSVRDIAKANGIKASALYNHFQSKQDLWTAILEQLKNMYFTFFGLMGEAVSRAGSFKETVKIILSEPKRLTNDFTTYGLSLITQERVNDPQAAELFQALSKFSVNFMVEKFEACVARGWARPFDTRAVALLIFDAINMGRTAKVQEFEGLPVPYRIEEMMTGLERFILWATVAKEPQTNPQ